MDFWTDIWPATLSAQQMLTSVDDDMSRLPESVRIFLLVNGAQGVIDNGGYNYFFEADWPGTPPYEVFADAYEAIGCIRQAADAPLPGHNSRMNHCSRQHDSAGALGSRSQFDEV